MKKKLIITIAAIAATTFANATVRTLNNNNPSPGQYTTYAAAEAASSQNDTIYVSGSPISYGDITVTKYNIMIMGTGHNPQKQNPLISEFKDIASTTVGQIRIDGIKCRWIRLEPAFGAAALFVSNSYIETYPKITTTNFDGAMYLDNNIINGLISTGGSYTYGIMAIVQGLTNVFTGIIRNNIIGGSIYVADGLSSSPQSIDGCIFTNNIFINSGGPSTGNLFSLHNGYFHSLFNNNIILGFVDHNINTLYAGTNTTSYDNNLIYPGSFVPALPNSSGTIFSNPLFVNYSCPSWNCVSNTAYDFHLQTSSPGHNAGTDGTDIGPYGGPYGGTFTTYGEPHIPQMKQMNMPATVVSGQTFNVNVISTVK